MNLQKGFSEVSKALPEWMNKAEKLVVLGVGNPVRGDDGVGIVILESLQIRSKNVRLIDCREVPENFFGEVINFKPDKVLFIDGVDAGLPFGEPLFYVFTGDLTHLRLVVSTHGIPLDLSANYITSIIDSEVALLGVQVSSTLFGKGLTPQVKNTARLLKSLLLTHLKEI